MTLTGRAMWESEERARALRRRVDYLTRILNRLDGAINHHQAAHQSGRFFSDLPDDALWKARDKIMSDWHEGKG